MEAKWAPFGMVPAPFWAQFVSLDIRDFDVPLQRNAYFQSHGNGAETARERRGNGARTAANHPRLKSGQRSKSI